MSASLQSPTPVPTLPQAFRVWLTIGIFSFGGPAAQIALMHRELVERRKWIDDARFWHALNYCLLLPGPEAQQLAVYIGWLLHKTVGGLVAGLCFVAPGALVMLGLTLLFIHGQNIDIVSGLFWGLKAAALALVIAALRRVAQRSLRHRWQVGLATVSFFALSIFEVPQPVVVVCAALTGLALGRGSTLSHVPQSPKPDEIIALTAIERLESTGGLQHTYPNHRRSVLTLVLCLAFWVLPFTILGVVNYNTGALRSEWLLFSKAALVTFGGAYAVLPFVAQQAVDSFQWLQPREMLDGLALAETTPGPLVLVLQFVGFIGAYRNPGALTSSSAGLLGAGMALWATFVPCFLWILVGAPYVESLRRNQHVHAALTGVAAAAVGCIASLSLWYAMHFLFETMRTISLGGLSYEVPLLSTIRPVALLLSALAILLTLRFQWSAARTLTLCALLGMAFSQAVH
jgi:chromate transporter